MPNIIVYGGKRLTGRIRAPGAKNAILPILGATLLTKEPVVIEDCPMLTDVDNMLGILTSLGCKWSRENMTLSIDTSSADKWEIPEALAKVLRSSIFMLGPVLGRFKKAVSTFPGGCEIGNRPIDLHIKGLRELNVEIIEKHGYIYCDGTNMRGADIHLDYPSVGATENLMMAAVSCKGKTVLRNAAREPEIQDLQTFLVKMGASVSGAGSSTIMIEGGKLLKGLQHKLLSDRIVAGTFMVASAITGGDVTVDNIVCEHMHSVLSKLRECGCSIDIDTDTARVRGPYRPREMRIIETLPYPGFPTDMQAQFFALACVADGTSVIAENVFENRFKHASELVRMGAMATIKDRMAIIRGVQMLTGAKVSARDLRGGAALVLAGLCAQGETCVEGAQYMDRGYEKIECSLAELGADIRRE